MQSQPMYPGQQPMYPGQPPMYPPPPAPRARGRTMAIVAVIVVVAVVVLAAVLYFLVFSQTKPTIALSSSTGTGSGFVVYVTNASHAYYASSYRVGLLTNVSAGGTGAMSLYTSITVSGEAYFVAWGDLNADGKLTVGDGFVVASTSGLLPGGLTFTFRILWGDGSVLASTSYQAQAQKPSVFFSTPTFTSNGQGFTFYVTSVSEPEPTSNFKVNFLVDTTPGIAVTLTATMSFTVSSTTYSVNYTDAAGEGSLTGGDMFLATTAGGLTAGTTYHVLLLWGQDGSEIFDAAFTA